MRWLCALDISFVDTDGNKVEPLQPVSVNFTLPTELLPEDVDASTLEVQHLKENEAGDTEYMYYDDVVYTVVIQVTNAEDGGLTYQVYANRDDNPEEKTDSLTFLNTYTPPAPAVTPKPTATPAPVAPTATPTGAFTLPQTGDTMPLITVLVVMLVAAAALVVLFVARKRKNNGK